MKLESVPKTSDKGMYRTRCSKIGGIIIMLCPIRLLGVWAALSK